MDRLNLAAVISAPLTYLIVGNWGVYVAILDNLIITPGLVALSGLGA